MAREYIHDREHKGIETKTVELFKIYYRKDCYFNDYKRTLLSNKQNRNGKSNGTGSFGTS